MPPNRSEYQPLAQNPDDEEADVSESLPQPATSTRGLRRAHRPVHIDLRNLDTAFKRCVFHFIHLGRCEVPRLYPPRWTESIAQKVKRKKTKVPDLSQRKQIWRSVFEPTIPGVPSPGPVCLPAFPVATDSIVI